MCPDRHRCSRIHGGDTSVEWPPPLAIVGLPETAIKESKEMVRSANINSGLEFPTRRITVNLASADLPKAGGWYDLAIALCILIVSGQLERRSLQGMEVLG